MIEPALNLHVANSQLYCNLSGEAVILNLTNGTYYGLNEVGTRIWELLQQNRTLNEIQETLVSEYDVEEDACRLSINALIAQLLAKGLLESGECDH